MMSPVTVLCRLGIMLAMVAAGSTVEVHAQVVRIRVIDVTSHRPMSGQNVSLALAYGKGERIPAKYDANPHLRTDANGEARFQLPDPAPHLVVAKAHLTSEYWHCICLAMETTQDIVQKGFVRPASRDAASSDTNSKPEPGVILFLARPFTFFERLFYPLLKE